MAPPARRRGQPKGAAMGNTPKHTCAQRRMIRRAVALACGGVILLNTLAGCSDDGTTSPTTTAIAETVEQYGARIQSECPGSDPGFDPFLSDHPTPTAADWAAFLPAPLKMVRDMRDCIASSNSPAVVADKVDAVVAAFDVVAVDLAKALTAAKEGDLDEVNSWLTQMHDVDQPKIDDAVARVGVS